MMGVFFNKIKYSIKNYLFPDEIFLREIFNNFPSSVFVFDRDLKKIIFSNDICKLLFRVNNERDLNNLLFGEGNTEPNNFFDFVFEKLNTVRSLDSKCFVQINENFSLRIRFKFSKFTHDANKICIVADDITAPFAIKEKEVADIVSSAQLKAVNDFARTFTHNFGNKFSPILYAVKKVINEAYSRRDESCDGCTKCLEKRKKVLDKNKDIVLNGMKCLQNLSKSVKNASRDYYIVNMKVFNLSDVIHNLINTFKETEENVKETFERVYFSESYPKKELLLYGMLERLEDAVTNVLTNAIRFSKQNPNKEKPQVDIVIKKMYGLDKNDENNKNKIEYYVISITDNGPGISPEVGDKVFEMGVTTKSVTDGAGIGLASAKRDISMFGGYISFECNQNPYRTTFRIMLPKKEIDDEKMISQETYDINIMVDVLVLNENSEEILKIKNSLSSKGITSMTATNMRTAINLVRVSSAKVFVISPKLDINTKGIDFLRRLITERMFNDPKIFIFTNLNETHEDVVEIMNEFECTYLDKTNIDCLVTNISQYLDKE